MPSERPTRGGAGHRHPPATKPLAPLRQGERRAGLHHLRKGQRLDALGKIVIRLESIVRRGQRDVLVPMTGQFLRRFGYLKTPRCRADFSAPMCRLRYGGFRPSIAWRKPGTLTLETLKLMSKPRCGLPDLEPEEIGGPGIEDSDPFVFGGTPWAQQQIRGSWEPALPTSLPK